MAKRKALKPSAPSKAYLVSFGDTMTALLAFFIVLNSLAEEQTGAAMYTGTGSFARAFSKSGANGSNFGNRSKYVMQQNAPKPIYALSENLELNRAEQLDSKKKVGPDDTNSNDRIIDRESEQFQIFLDGIRRDFGLKQEAVRSNQTVIDSFDPMLNSEDKFTAHAQELLPEALLSLRKSACVEIVLWAASPSPETIRSRLAYSEHVRDKINAHFWLKEDQKARLLIRVKPWLFSDAKRPDYSVVLSDWQSPTAGTGN